MLDFFYQDCAFCGFSFHFFHLQYTFLYGLMTLIVSALEVFHVDFALFRGFLLRALFQFQFHSVKFTFKGNFKDKMGVMQPLLSYKGFN